MGKPHIIWRNWFYPWIRRPNVSYSMCNCCGAMTTANGRFFYEKPHFTMENYLGGCKLEVEHFCIKLPKGTPLRQIWLNKSFGVCSSNVVLTLYGDEKKITRKYRNWKLDVVYNTTSLPRRLDLTLKTKIDVLVSCVFFAPSLCNWNEIESSRWKKSQN